MIVRRKWENYEKLDEHIKKYGGDADNEDDFSIYKIVEGKDVYIFKYPVDIDKITYLGKK